MSISEDAVREELKKVIDPELFVNIVDLGLVYVVDLQPSEEESKTDVNIEMTLTSPMCPAGPQLVANSRQVVEAMEGVGKIDVKVVMTPPWSPDCMTEDARDQLGIF
jgi:metal-sulfur cluster biosynthetic enzyme